MRKRELVHLHTLLSRIRRFVERREDLPEDAFDGYEAADVAPTAVYEPKGDHEAAVSALAGTLAATVEADGGDRDADAEAVSQREAEGNVDADSSAGSGAALTID